MFDMVYPDIIPEETVNGRKRRREVLSWATASDIYFGKYEKRKQHKSNESV